MDGQLIPMYVMGKRYDVPQGLTIMTAMEWIGYKYIRGCGCRGGACGACATVFRLPGEYKLKFGLACQTMVIPSMHLVQVPFYPNPKKQYFIDADQLGTPATALLKLFPEIAKCVGCGACAKACPMELRPIDYIAAAMRGDWEKTAELSFDCLMCGLCASRCTGELVPHNIAIFVRRYYAKIVRTKPAGLIKRNKDIRDGLLMPAVKELAAKDEATLRKLYDQREFENIDGHAKR